MEVVLCSHFGGSCRRSEVVFVGVGVAAWAVEVGGSLY